MWIVFYAGMVVAIFGMVVVGVVVAGVGVADAFDIVVIFNTVDIVATFATSAPVASVVAIATDTADDVQ